MKIARNFHVFIKYQLKIGNGYAWNFVVTMVYFYFT